MHSTRLTEPALNFEQLPPLDLVLLSHMHEDHFDNSVSKKLDKNTPIVTTKEVAHVLSKKGFKFLQELETWETFAVTKGEVTLRITAMPGKHAPVVISKLMPPIMGSMLEFQIAGKTVFHLYITGDTLIHEQLKEIFRRYPEIDLALLHLGGTKVMGLLLTMDAKQGVEAIKIIRPQTAIPIHYNDYTVFKSPLQDFKQAVATAQLEKQVQYVRQGDTYNFEVPSSRLNSIVSS